jgi:hypothetical protein
MVKKSTDEKTAIRLCNQNTDALKQVNKKILYYLDRLPLADQRDVVKLNALVEEQEKLLRVPLQVAVPLGVSIFNDNERYRANHLGRRFREAQRKDRIRAPLIEKEKEKIYFGNIRTPTLHLSKCRWIKKMLPKNIVLFTSRQDAVNQGYTPCKVCKP